MWFFFFLSSAKSWRRICLAYPRYGRVGRTRRLPDFSPAKISELHSGWEKKIGKLPIKRSPPKNDTLLTVKKETCWNCLLPERTMGFSLRIRRHTSWRRMCGILLILLQQWDSICDLKTKTKAAMSLHGKQAGKSNYFYSKFNSFMMWVIRKLLKKCSEQA